MKYHVSCIWRPGAANSRRLCKDKFRAGGDFEQTLSSNRLYALSSVDGRSDTGLSWNYLCFFHLSLLYGRCYLLTLLLNLALKTFPTCRSVCLLSGNPGQSLACLAERVSCLLATLPESWGWEVIEDPGDPGLPLDGSVKYVVLDLWTNWFSCTVLFLYCQVNCRSLR